MKLKKITALMMAGVVLASCSSSGSATKEEPKKEEFKVAMITDTGGVNDRSFNQSAWEGLQELEKATGAKVSYIESKAKTDYVSNFDSLVDGGNSLLWGIGYDTADAVLEAAEANEDVNFAIVDNAYENTPANVTGVLFKAEEPSFMVGYIAGMTTETNKVGYVGGIKSALLEEFLYGYQAGVAYAAKEKGVEIEVLVQWAESFSDSAKGKAIAYAMITSGADVVYQVAGGTGIGVIEACKENNKWAIGVDRDQSELAPDHVLTSALKLVNKAVVQLSTDFKNGVEIGGKTFTYGLADGCVGIPENNKNLKEGLYEKTMEIKDQILEGKITPPKTLEEYNTFVKGL